MLTARVSSPAVIFSTRWAPFLFVAIVSSDSPNAHTHTHTQPCKGLCLCPYSAGGLGRSPERRKLLFKGTQLASGEARMDEVLEPASFPLHHYRPGKVLELPVSASWL